MQNITRILAIAPYEGLRQILIDLVHDFEETVTVSTYVGDLEKGLEKVSQLDMNDYDIVLSRGGTAKLIESNIDLPVINMTPTVFDVLRLVRVARNLTNRYAIVAYPDIADIATKLFNLVELNETVRVIHSPEEAQTVLEFLKADHYNLIIGDAITVSTASQMNLNAILITSGVESVKASITQAIKIHGLISGLQKQNRLLRRILDTSPTFITAIDEKQKVLYSNASMQTKEQATLMKEMLQIASEEKSDDLQRTVRLEQNLWNLQRRYLPNDKSYVFYINQRNNFSTDRKHAINSRLIREVIPQTAADSIGEMQKIHEQAEKASRRGLSVYIYGEKGVPIDDVLQTLLKSANRAETCWIIDCEKLDEATVKRLVENIDSPLMDRSRIVLIQNIYAFPEKQRSAYFDFVKETKFHSRCKVIYTTNLDPGKAWTNFLGTCMSWQLPPLRKRRNDIPTLINLYIAEWNYTLGRQIIGIKPDAISALQEYDWPGNNEQLRSVIRQAMISADEDMLTLSEIQPALHTGSIGQNSASIPIEGSLLEIEQRILHTVLTEENGNRNRTAERLGISRSTLWRMLKMTN